ncbi:MAG: hypothetical protein IPM51_08485 [Sphingobacteriaceae bacterium]|nr:hypothetical protein [Sphingobacteriaceae bacterium]
MKLHLLFILPAVVLLQSCKNELKLNAPYKELPSIHAVLNPEESVHMIRINKVFLGEGDANQMALVSDSINYPAGEITVTMERFVNGAKVAATPTGNKSEITFRDSVVTAEPGAFSRTQRVYVTYDVLYGEGEYRLKVKNNRSGNEFTAKATSLSNNIPSSYTVWYPFHHYYGDPDNVNNLTDQNIFINYDKELANNQPFSIKIEPKANAILYQLEIRLHYYDSLNSGINEYHYIKHSFPRLLTKDAVAQNNQGPFLTYNFRRLDLLNNVEIEMNNSSKPINEIVGRKMYKIEFRVYKTTEEYLDYLEYTSPSLSIAQEKPLYSNFDDKKALGIFTFRSTYSIEREMAIPFKDMFAYSSITCKFKFLTTGNTLPLCN